MKWNIYGYPKLNGSGLGNLLWIWAKCFVWCKDNDAKLITPSWLQFHPNRIIGRNPDLRLYWCYFMNRGYINGPEKYYRLWKHRTISADDAEKKKIRNFSCIVVFSELGSFTPLIGRHKEVYDELIRITNPRFILPSKTFPFVAMHIRRGDFEKGTAEQLYRGETNLQVPLEWYIASLRALRDAIGFSFKVIIFSDGSNDEIVHLLKEPNVERSNDKNALRDLFLMSSAAGLIASRSSFSLWASYLGQIPALYHRGAKPWHEGVIHTKPAGSLEPEWEESFPLPVTFTAAVSSRLTVDKNL